MKPGEDNNDVRVFKNIAKISIPKQLTEFDGARFILIDKKEGKGKKPKERKWTTEKNYSANDPKLLGHIRGGGNYGIATGLGWLHCFDADEVEILRERGVLEKLPTTFTVRTGGNGLHYWYKIEGLQKRIIFYDPVRKEKDNEEEYLHLGEVQSRGNYAIGPGCIHHSGNRYEIINDCQIAELDYTQLMEILKPLRTKKKDDRPKTNPRCGEGQHSHAEVDLDKIGWPRGNVTELNGSNGTEYRGEHPFHGSKTGQNFAVNQGKGVWHCFRHGSGGGWIELLAVREGIISCEQAGRGCLTKKQYREVLQRAEELGLVKETTIDAPIKEIQLDREFVDEIPKKIPDGPMTLLVAPPRTGKTHAVVQWLERNGSGNYITHNHAIVEHAIKIAKELRMCSVVWVIGMGQHSACINGGKERDCTKCPLNHTKDNHFEIEREAIKLLKEKEVLTPDNIPKDYCPYYTLKAAEKHARYCFTVVNNINSIIPRKLVILDEEPVLSHFYATSIEVATMKNRIGDERSQNRILMSKDLQHDMTQILEKKKQPRFRKYAEKLNEISNIIEYGRDNGMDTEEIAGEIEDALIDFKPEIPNLSSDARGSDSDELTMEQCVRCLGKIYREDGKSPVSIARKAGGYQSIYILGNERNTAYAMDWLEKTEKVIIIGATKAEIFIKEFGGRELSVEKFRYDNRFTVLGLDAENKEGNGRGMAAAQKKKVLETAATFWKSPDGDYRAPFMVLTGSKKEQESVASRIQGAMQVRKEREKGMEWARLTGMPAVIFQNSVISRGLDVDQYNLMFVYGCNFAQPFWAVADPGIASAIIADETTNSVLRISSTLRNDINTMKVIVMRKNDVEKVKYLSNIRIVSNSASELARMLSKLGVAGKTKLEGRKSISSTSHGTNFESGKEKMIELISGTDTAFDEGETLSVMERILSMLREKSKNGEGILSTRDIRDSIKTKSGKDIIYFALQTLYSSGRLNLESRGKAKKWSIKRV